MTNGRLAIVAERQSFFSAGIAAVLQRELGFARVVRVYDYASLIEVLANNGAADFLALDLDLPGAARITTVSELSELRPAMRLAVFSDRADVQDILSVLAAGAHGFIPKQITDCAELLRALKTVNEMGVYVPGNLVGAQGAGADDGDHQEATNGTLVKLTERQQQVVNLLSLGHPNKVIARELGISPSTVKVHVHAAFRALGVHSRLAALASLRSTQPLPPTTVDGRARHAVSP